MPQTRKTQPTRRPKLAQIAKPKIRRASKGTDGSLALPEIVYANVSPHSIGGVSMFDAGARINSQTVANFTSEPELMARAVAKLRDAGFQVLQVSEATINIAGPPKTYERAFGAPIVVTQKEVIKKFGQPELAEFLDCPNTDMLGLISVRGTDFEQVIEGIAIEEPRYYMAANPFPPSAKYWHLDVPGDVSLACNADRAHRGLITGKEVKVAMVDSGWFKHPFFVERGYRVSTVTLGPAAANPNDDESGHGTGESANIFAAAPDARLLPVKMNFVNSTGAFNAAIGLNPDIITCSWGSSVEFGPLSAANQVLATAVASAVAAGITVVFAAGNGHYGFPGQHPDVISAGGVFMNADGSMRASDYASGFPSNVYSGRTCPDVCGLVGMKPRAIYIMLPLQPGDDIDTGNAGGVHPDGDETANNDGWAAFSGTSAAAPQLAGVAALIKEACPRLSPAEIRQIMRDTARDVTTGNCNTSSGGHAATVGHDLATGHGLVDAHRAVLMAKLRCGPIIGPIQPIQPIQPVRPIRPIGPIQPVGPGPVNQSDAPLGQPRPSVPLREEDIETLDDMMRKGQIDPSEV